MDSRTIDAVDTIWLNMDRATNLMVIESLMLLEDPMDWDRLLEVFRQRVLEAYPVFSQRAVPGRFPLMPPRWQPDEEFSLERHVRRVTLPTPGDDQVLQEYVNEHLSTPLPRDRPLWELHLIDGYGDGAAVYARLHHALADGMALMQVLLSMTDETADVGPGVVPQASGPDRGPRVSVAHVAGVTASAVLDASRLLSISGLGHATRLAQQTAGVATKLLLSHTPDTAVSGVATTSKTAIWAPPVPLADVVAVAHRTGTTVNDVLMSALAGALTTYVEGRGGEPVDIPTMVPVNLRPVDEPLPRALGNRFALVLLTLPSALRSPFARLAETKRRMDAIKSSPEAWLTFGMIEGIGRTGREVERVVVDFFANKATGVTTNVPGPRTIRFLAGNRITGMLGWAPESGEQSLGTAIFTYAGQVFIGFKVDTGVIPDPEVLLAAFVDELDALCRLAPSA
jgi:WS/DGAT/MGAT family acyltransferase